MIRWPKSPSRLAPAMTSVPWTIVWSRAPSASGISMSASQASLAWAMFCMPTLTPPTSLLCNGPMTFITRGNPTTSQEAASFLSSLTSHCSGNLNPHPFITCSTVSGDRISVCPSRALAMAPLSYPSRSGRSSWGASHPAILARAWARGTSSGM